MQSIALLQPYWNRVVRKLNFFSNAPNYMHSEQCRQCHANDQSTLGHAEYSDWQAFGTVFDVVQCTLCSMHALSIRGK